MAEQIQRPKTSQAKEREQASDISKAQAASKKTGDQLKEELDDLLDEIDGVLEVNAEEFVKTYIQKGGQ